MGLNRVLRVENTVEIKSVIMSVWDKTGLDDFARSLVKLNPSLRIYSTGGTFTFLDAALGPDSKKNLVSISDYTGMKEMQGGLVKTLNHKIYLGLLAESSNPSHIQDVNESMAVFFDMVVVNLYPFENVVSTPDIVCEDARTHIDIGGPCMLRACAKNYLRCAPVCDPADYPKILRELEDNRFRLSFGTRFSLMAKTFERTAAYDKAICEYFSKRGDPSCYQFEEVIDT